MTAEIQVTADHVIAYAGDREVGRGIATYTTNNIDNPDEGFPFRLDIGDGEEVSVRSMNTTTNVVHTELVESVKTKVQFPLTEEWRLNGEEGEAPFESSGAEVSVRHVNASELTDQPVGLTIQ